MGLNYKLIVKALFQKYILRQNTGKVIKEFCMKQGTVYIKVAQMLSTQNIGNVFTEKDRKELAEICDNINPISFGEIKKAIEQEYQENIEDIFEYIDPISCGSASISQVHKAMLKNGDIVAIKVKRKDATANIDRDIESFRKLMYKGGKLIGFKNASGGDKALDLYLKWIHEETDFINEKQNIKKYRQFAESVNGKVENTKEIKAPKVYEELCTENIIVMEFIESKTIKQMELDKNDKKVITKAMNSYLQLCFYALFNNKKVVFHGDPHSGNIYITDNGDIGFLDMGLIFELTEEEANKMKKTFLSIYLNDLDKLYDLLVIYGNFDEKEKNSFKMDIKEQYGEYNDLPITSYFTEMISVCTRHKIKPPDYLFSMAKAFFCLGGINGFTKNYTGSKEILKEQTTEFLVRTGIEKTKGIIKSSMNVFTGVAKITLKKGLPSAIAKEEQNLSNLINDATEIFDYANAVIRSYSARGNDKTDSKHF